VTPVDFDLVVALSERDVEALVGAFAADFYIDADAARTAVSSERMFKASGRCSTT
jgi:hypothetical protein